MYFRNRWEKEHPDMLLVSSLTPRLRDTILWAHRSCYVQITKRFNSFYCSARQITYASMWYAKTQVDSILIVDCWYRGKEVVELLLGDYEGTLIEQANYVYEKITGQQFHNLHEVETEVQEGKLIDYIELMLGGRLSNGLAPYIERIKKEFSKEDYKDRIVEIQQSI